MKLLERRATKSKFYEKTSHGFRYSKIVGKAKDHAPVDPLLKIISNADLAKYKMILDSLSFKKNATFVDKMKVSPQNLTRDDDQSCIKMQNHLPLNGLLGNKKAMFYNIREYCRLTNKKTSDYVPLTFHIKKGLLDDEFKALSAIFSENRKYKKNNFWILKPG